MRPEELQKIPITSLKGVGAKRAEMFARLDISTAYDLIFHYPRAYEDWRPYKIADAPLNETCAVQAVMSTDMTGAKVKKNMTIYKGTAFDETGKLWLTIFNAQYAAKQLRQGSEFVFYGKVEGNDYRKAMSSPKFIKADKAPPVVARYPATEGLTQNVIASTVADLLKSINRIDDPLPYGIVERLDLMSLDDAVRAVHRPSTEDELAKAFRRLVFSELFYMELGLMSMARKNRARTDSVAHKGNMKPFFESLPFKLTDAQMRAITEGARDMMKTTPMNRLLQGDVGSGKTAVAAALMYFAYQSGFQSAMMAPTEILAQQHFETLKSFLRPLGMQVALLTSSVKGAVREDILEGLAGGEINVLVGTHAVIGEKVVFSDLGFVVTDEQHRFGVHQRAALTKKGGPAHTLVMSATPIPRTLALMIYGDLDISVLDELPPGRREIKTYLVDSAARDRVDGFIEKHIQNGRQVYVVCPAIEEGVKESVTQHFERLKKRFPNHSVGLLHGQMKTAQKEQSMIDFVEGRVNVLVSTTVIEVGVDVPNATLMVIEEADCFGLSQLHQLRGRVGRSDKQSFCVLISDAEGTEAKSRLSAMVETSDGFEIARRDLELRGPGDFFGSRQHGLPLLRIADLHSDMDTLQLAAREAATLLERDPDLSKPEHRSLKAGVDILFEQIPTDN